MDAQNCRDSRFNRYSTVLAIVQLIGVVGLVWTIGVARLVWVLGTVGLLEVVGVVSEEKPTEYLVSLGN